MLQIKNVIWEGGGRKYIHHTSIRMAKVKKIDNSKVGRDVEALELSDAAGEMK